MLLAQALGRGRLLVDTFGAGHVHSDPLDSAAAEYWLARETERIASGGRIARGGEDCSFTPLPSAIPGKRQSQQIKAAAAGRPLRIVTDDDPEAA